MTTTPKRKTAKYYREILSGNDIRKAIAVVPEVLEKFVGEHTWMEKGVVKHTGIYQLKFRFSEVEKNFNWNHCLEGFSYNSKTKRVVIDIYWQGDSTDGNCDAYAEELIYGKVIPAEYSDGYCRHSTLRIDADELPKLLKVLADYITPSAIKARKVEDERRAKRTAVYDYIAEQVKSKDVEYWNGRQAVQELFETKPEVCDLPLEELKSIALKVWKNNNRSDYYLRGNSYYGEKKFNLAY